MLCVVGCSERPPTKFSSKKFQTAPANEDGTFVTMFSVANQYSIKLYNIAKGEVEERWSSVAQSSIPGVSPFVSITSYGDSPDSTVPARFHFTTGEGGQHFETFPEGLVRWNNLTGGSGSLDGETIIFSCAFYPEDFDGTFALNNGPWSNLSTYVEKSSENGWCYWVATATTQSHPR